MEQTQIYEGGEVGSGDITAGRHAGDQGDNSISDLRGPVADGRVRQMGRTHRGRRAEQQDAEEQQAR